MATISSFGGKDFFSEVVNEQTLLGLSSSYENKKFRNQALADLLFEALPEFALDFDEYSTLDATNAIRRMRAAARTVYNTDKYGRRGEFGELFLHLVIRDYFHTIPAVSKIFYKDSNILTGIYSLAGTLWNSDEGTVTSYACANTSYTGNVCGMVQDYLYYTQASCQGTAY